ncbi:hypothetical protein [Arenibaculum sp.]|jgi:bacterioferritin-associated ferredoxin|uniref:hypothetical protein n=1 Tax=Arenibaculum sp. TaxID=2865862 RepID=UPI002E0F6B22|nr:hypothetical protein [Arenibaculum sp.]
MGIGGRRHGNRRRLMAVTACGPAAAGRGACPDGPDCGACERAAVDVLARTLWAEAGRDGQEALAAAILGRVGPSGCRPAAIRRACPVLDGVRPAKPPEPGDLVYETCLRIARRCVYGRPEARPS